MRKAPRKSPTSRNLIIQTLSETLAPLDYVYAMWEGGAVGYGRLDRWSDVDLYVDAEDKHVKEVFRKVEKALDSLSAIELRYSVPEAPGQGYSHAFYRLAGTSKFLLIDLAVFRHSCEDKFLESRIHGRVYFLFNKRNVIKCSTLNKKKLVRDLRSRKARIQERFDTFGCFVEKEIGRGNWIEALDLYRGLVLDSLVEALRMRHKPEHHQFKTRYIHYDLPREIVRKLKGLYFVENEEDLKKKHRIAERWLRKALKEVDLREVERRL